MANKIEKSLSETKRIFLMNLFYKFKTIFGIAVFFLFSGNASRAVSISYVGDSQSAFPHGLFDKLQPMILKVGNIMLYKKI